jgi:hypothetical protein
MNMNLEERCLTSSVFQLERFSLSLIPGHKVLELPNLRKDWENLLSSSSNLGVMYQSPEWCEHLIATDFENSQLSLGLAKDDKGRIIGIVPIRVGIYNLKFDVYASALWKTKLRTASILGSQPLLPNDVHLYESLFASIWNNLPECDCIYMDSIPTDSHLWQYLKKSGSNQKKYMIYVPDGLRPYHSILLPATFDEYVSKFKRKKRYNLERQVNLLRDHGNGRLEMLRVDSGDQIQTFLEGAVAVAKGSWQQTRIGTRIDKTQESYIRFTDLTQRSLLRSYLLLCRDTPCAFVLGYQYRDVYHYAEIAYDQSFAKFSPGTVLLYLLIRDLIQYKPPRRINFGIGQASYKEEFGNIHNEDASVLLLRNNIKNKIRRIGHSSFRSSIHMIKRKVLKNR